jgi:hypothetical protein
VALRAADALIPAGLLGPAAGVLFLKIPKGTPCYSALEAIMPTRADVDKTNDTTKVISGTKIYATTNLSDTQKPVHQLQVIK